MRFSTTSLPLPPVLPWNASKSPPDTSPPIPNSTSPPPIRRARIRYVPCTARRRRPLRSNSMRAGRLAALGGGDSLRHLWRGPAERRGEPDAQLVQEDQGDHLEDER